MCVNFRSFFSLGCALQMRESEVQFLRWIFSKREKTGVTVVVGSVLLHALIFLCAYYVKPKKEITAAHTSPPVHVSFSQLTEQKKQVAPTQHLNTQQSKLNKQEILTDKNKNSRAKFLSHDYTHVKKQDLEKNRQAPTPEPQKTMSSFLPSSNSDYVDNVREQSVPPTEPIQGDAGDIPIQGPSLAPTNEPRVVSRYSQKDMSLFQFTQEFRERFGAVWNAEDRFVPPSSPLRPGDVVYYKVYIQSNGVLEKFDNLSKKSHPQKDYTEIDKIFSDVVGRVFPMVVPPKFANKNVTLTEVVAIQVVDRTSPIHFSF